VGLTALHLAFLPWALGAVHPWSQLVSLGLSTVGFILALWPRPGHRPIARLQRRPVFWGGLALLGYIALQGGNPAWNFMRDAGRWWLEPVTHLAWLPSGMDVPWPQSGPWRMLIVFGSLWLLVSSVWAGFLRRQSYWRLFALLVANATGLALLSALQQLTGTKKIFWLYTPSNGSFSASFIYPNHAGAYLNLMVALAAGLAWWHHRRAHERLEKPGRATAFALAAMALGLMVIFSYSRTSIILLLVFTACLGGVFAIRLLRAKGSVLRRPEFAPLALAVALLLGFGFVVLRNEKVWTRFAALAEDPASAARGRTLARQAATDMLRDRWLLGWGAGCFRYGFTHYVRNYPEIDRAENGAKMFWEHAHNDLLEFPVELGAIGLLPLVGLLGYGAWQFTCRRVWRNVISLCVGLGCTLTLVHAGVDFVFQCPAVLLTWAVLFFAAGRWHELDRSIARAPSPGPLRKIVLPVK
jgi:O-antigen ligase